MNWSFLRPALPGGFVSALADLGRRAGLALWRSFWSLWGNPMAYPIVGVIAIGMFALGYGEGKDGAAALRVSIVDLRGQVAKAKADTQAAEKNLAAARREVAEAKAEMARIKDALEGIRPPAATPRAPAARPAPKAAVKAEPDTSWKPF